MTERILELLSDGNWQRITEMKINKNVPKEKILKILNILQNMGLVRVKLDKKPDIEARITTFGSKILKL